MKYKEIKLEDNKSILVDETAKIKKNTNTFNEGLNGDWFYNSIYKSIARIGDITAYDFKIIATINYSISLDIPMVIIEDEVDLGTLAEKEYLRKLDNFEKVDFKDGVFFGYKAAQQEKSFTLDNVHAIIDLARKEPRIMIGDIIESLKQEYIELEIDLYCELKDCIEQNPNCVLPNSGVCKAREVIKTNRVDGQLIAYKK